MNIHITYMWLATIFDMHELEFRNNTDQHSVHFLCLVSAQC